MIEVENNNLELVNQKYGEGNLIECAERGLIESL